MRSRLLATLSITALLTVLSVGDGLAGIVRCRSDPAVVLSTGAIVDLSADVDGFLWDIENVDYTMHVPAGAQVVAIVRTPNWPTTKETFNVIADAPAGVYDTTTTVRTKKAGQGVTANLVVKTLTNVLGLKSANGVSGSPIQVTITTR